jgi:hypothetical protein
MRDDEQHNESHAEDCDQASEHRHGVHAATKPVTPLSVPSVWETNFALRLGRTHRMRAGYVTDDDIPAMAADYARARRRCTARR